MHFECLFYVGDAPITSTPGLPAGSDVAFQRRGYPMRRPILEAHNAEPSVFRATRVPGRPPMAGASSL